MRTTIDIPDGMYRRLKSRAAGEGRSVKALILNSVEQALADKTSANGRPITLPLIKAKRPGSVTIDHARIYDVISFP